VNLKGIVLIHISSCVDSGVGNYFYFEGLGEGDIRQAIGLRIHIYDNILYLKSQVQQIPKFRIKFRGGGG